MGGEVGEGSQMKHVSTSFSQIDIMLQERETKKKRAEESRSGRVKTKENKNKKGSVDKYRANQKGGKRDRRRKDWL